MPHRPDRSVKAWRREARASCSAEEGAQWSPSFRITKETRDDGSLAYDRFESRRGPPPPGGWRILKATPALGIPTAPGPLYSVRSNKSQLLEEQRAGNSAATSLTTPPGPLLISSRFIVDRLLRSARIGPETTPRAAQGLILSQQSTCSPSASSRLSWPFGATTGDECEDAGRGVPEGA